MTNFMWLNESEIKKYEEKKSFAIYAPGKTDYFNNPVSNGGKYDDPIGNAPFYYTEMEGDFVFRVLVRPEFQDVFDAASIMVIENDKLWAKAAFEKTDFGTFAIVGVVTNSLSDDTNGVNIQQDEVWLQMTRVDNCFAIHYSLDGENYYMMRLFTLPLGKSVKVGVEAQSPVGKGGYRYFDNLSIELKTVHNIRSGK